VPVLFLPTPICGKCWRDLFTMAVMETSWHCDVLSKTCAERDGRRSNEYILNFLSGLLALPTLLI
ncbi:MAG: hypothetical protein WC856_20505, partial [Methylococcaceae bacterium]